MGNPARKLDAVDNDTPGFTQPPRELRLEGDPEYNAKLNSERKGTKGKVAQVLNSDQFGRKAAKNNEGWFTLENMNDARDVLKMLNRLRKARDKGELNQADFAEALNAVLDFLDFEKLRAISPLLVPILGFMLDMPSEPLAKIAPNYTDLSGQILGFTEDEDKPGSYMHSVEGLCRNLNEVDLRNHFGLFYEKKAFTDAMKNTKGKAKLYKQFEKLFGPDLDHHDLFLSKSRMVLERLGCSFTTSAPSSPVSHTKNLRSKGADRSLKRLVEGISNARDWMTESRLDQITNIEENPTVSKDMDAFGNTLLEEVHGDPGLAEKFVEQFNEMAFKQTYRLLLDPIKLGDALAQEPETVRQQIYKLYKLEGHVDEIELKDHAAAIKGALGNRNDLSTPALQAKFDIIQACIDRATHNLTQATPPGKSALEELFPPNATKIEYKNFGLSLRGLPRGKSPTQTIKAIESFCRGYDTDEFQDYFMVLLDPTLLTPAVNGSTEDRMALRERIREITGLISLGTIPSTLFRGAMTQLILNLGTAASLDPSVHPQHAALVRDLSQVIANLGPAVIDKIFKDETLWDKMGEKIRTTSSNQELYEIFNKISPVDLALNYGFLRGNNAALLASRGNYPQIKAQLYQLIGNPGGVRIDKALLGTLIADFKANKIALVNRIYRNNTGASPHPGAQALEDFLDHIDREFDDPLLANIQ